MICFFFQTFSGYGLNSLAWNKVGKYLLVTSNNTYAFTMVKRKVRSIQATVLSGDCVTSMPGRPKPDKADLFGVFHPLSAEIFFIATSAGTLMVRIIDYRNSFLRI